MFTIKQPSTIVFGMHSARDYVLPKDSLIITSKGAKSRGWLEYVKLDNADVFDCVEPNPSIETTQKILNKFIKDLNPIKEFILQDNIESII